MYILEKVTTRIRNQGDFFDGICEQFYRAQNMVNDPVTINVL